MRLKPLQRVAEPLTSSMNWRSCSADRTRRRTEHRFRQPSYALPSPFEQLQKRGQGGNSCSRRGSMSDVYEIPAAALALVTEDASAAGIAYRDAGANFCTSSS